MQPPQHTNASSSTVAHALRIPAVPALRRRRSNRASRSLNSQSVAGASRRLKSQKLEGASRRLNSQSVAECAAPSLPGTDTQQWLRPQRVYGHKSAMVQQLTGRPAAPRMYCPFWHCGTPALPNPSFKPSPNGVARWPSSAGPSAHFALAVQRATPSVPA